MEIGDGFCAAHADAHAKCASVYKFDDMTIDAKQDLATACGFSWPCKVRCFANQEAPLLSLSAPDGKIRVWIARRLLVNKITAALVPRVGQK